MQLKRLKAFHTVAQLGSFSDAIGVTGLSQPTLSRLIKQLEEDIGVELIDRYHRPLQLTPAGGFFYEKVDLILRELDSTITLTQKMAHPPDTLNIGFVPSVLYGLLPTIISRLKQRLPSLDIHLKDISSFRQVDALKAGEIDVGFGRFAHDDANLNQLLLRHERYVVALPKIHDLADQHDIHLKQLQDSRIILYHQTHLPISNISITVPDNNDAPLFISEPLLHLFSKQSALPHHTTSVSDIQVALGLVAAGEGITLVPDSLKSVRSDQISYRTLIHEDATSPIYLCALQAPTHPAFSILLDVIYDIYEERGVTYRRINKSVF